MEISKGRRVSKAQFFKGRYDTKLEFLEGLGDSNKKKPSVGGGGMVQQHIAFELVSLAIFVSI